MQCGARSSVSQPRFPDVPEKREAFGCLSSLRQAVFGQQAQHTFRPSTSLT